jgi:hypothetical protein
MATKSKSVFVGYEPNPEHLKYAEGVVAFCEATDNERQSIWERYCNKSSACQKDLIDTFDYEVAAFLEVGSVGGMPVFLMLTPTLVNGKRVLFYYPSSQVIDWRMIEDFISYLREAVKKDTGVYPTQSDADNFDYEVIKRCPKVSA